MSAQLFLWSYCPVQNDEAKLPHGPVDFQAFTCFLDIIQLYYSVKQKRFHAEKYLQEDLRHGANPNLLVHILIIINICMPPHGHCYKLLHACMLSHEGNLLLRQQMENVDRGLQTGDFIIREQCLTQCSSFLIQQIFFPTSDTSRTNPLGVSLSTWSFISVPGTSLFCPPIFSLVTEHPEKRQFSLDAFRERGLQLHFTVWGGKDAHFDCWNSPLLSACPVPHIFLLKMEGKSQIESGLGGRRITGQYCSSPPLKKGGGGRCLLWSKKWELLYEEDS